MHPTTATHNPPRTEPTERITARRLAALAVVAVSIGLAPGAAAGADTGGCGRAWTLATQDEVVEAVLDANDVDRGPDFEASIRDAFDLANRNGDGFVCWRYNDGNRGQDKVYVDLEWDLDGHYRITNVNDNNSRPLT